MTIRSSKMPQNKRYSLIPIHGDCLQRIGVNNQGGGYAIIDHNATVRVGDLVHCSEITGQIVGYIKQVKEINGDSVIVGTAYLDPTRDFQFECAEIFGVVVETYGKVWNHREYIRPKATKRYSVEPQIEGEWIYGYFGKLPGTDARYRCKCSLCKGKAVEASVYCPSCGKKMKGGAQE